jgi:cupin fold WbuC family metalloprotein
MSKMQSENSSPSEQLALTAPPEPLAILDRDLMDRSVAASRQATRKRIILPFHKSHEDAFQRMLNTIQPGSYIRPHRHIDPPKAESILVLRGALCFIVFTDRGLVERHFDLRFDGPRIGVDMEPGIWHTFFALAPDTVVFEAKPGPYRTATDKDFARWAPKENDPEAKGYLADLYAATSNATALPVG